MFKGRFKRLSGLRKSAARQVEFYVFALGNPGGKYAHTRHNAGFDVADIVAQREGARFTKSMFNAKCATCDMGSRTVMLVKPQCFMNNSGVVVRDFVRGLNIPPDRFVVVYDDVDLPLGKVRIKARGSAGTHNGMRSIVYQLNSDDFPRLRVGIGKNSGDIVDYVLTTYNDGERETAFDGYSRAADALSVLITEGLTAAQQRYNG